MLVELINLFSCRVNYYRTSGVTKECTVPKGVGYNRVNTEWQRKLSGVHSLMMEKSALAGGGGGRTPTPFHSIYPQSCSVLQLSGQIHPRISSLPYLYRYSVQDTHPQVHTELGANLPNSNSSSNTGSGPSFTFVLATFTFKMKYTKSRRKLKK
jgi:hypothetical protein